MIIGQFWLEQAVQKEERNGEGRLGKKIPDYGVFRDKSYSVLVITILRKRK